MDEHHKDEDEQVEDETRDEDALYWHVLVPLCRPQGKQENLEAHDDEDGPETCPVRRHGAGRSRGGWSLGW